MASPRAKRLSFRTTGLIVALGVFLIACGVIGLIAVWNRPKGTGPAIAAKPPPVMPKGTPSLTQLGLQNAGKARVQFVAKDDPTRVIGFLEWASLEPTGPGKAVIDQPRAEIFMRDGNTVLVRAATGTVVYPVGQPMQPESGTFDGGVTMEVLGPGAGEQPGQPIARAFTPRLAFSGALGELSADGPVRASGEQFEFSGKGVRLVGNEVEMRIELLEVDRADYFWLAEGARATGQRPKPVPGDQPAPPEPNAKAGTAREVFYHVTLGDQVRVDRRAMTLTTDRLQAWAHLINNALPADALGPHDGAKEPDPSPTEPQRQRADRPFTRQPPTRSPAIAGEPPSLFAGLNDPNLVEVTWHGPLTLVPLADKPAQLAQESVAVACQGKGDAAVTAIDAELAASATAESLSYGVTSGQLALRGESVPARLALHNKGSIELREGWLNTRTGAGGARGLGKLEAADSTPDDPRWISWNDSVEFALNTRGGRMGDRLNDASFRGDVQAREGKGELRADSAHAIFGGFEHPQGPLEGQLLRIETRGDVRAADGRGGTMSGGEMDLDFEPAPSGKNADPRSLTARGTVVAQRDGWRLACNTLEANLDRDERNDVIVTNASAKGDASISGRGVESRADHIAADVQRQIVDLIGQPATIARDGGTITGTQIRLEGLREELFVFGEGKMDVERPTTTGEPHKVNVAWQKSMSFNNLDGKAECSGAVEVVSTPSPMEQETLKAERVLLAFTPGRGLPELTTPGGADAAPTAPATTERRLLRAEAIGESEEREGGAKATIESKRFAAASGPTLIAGADRPVERLIYAEGDRLIADDAQGSQGLVLIPGEGRLLIDDRRASSAPASKTEPAASRGTLPADLSGARGTSLFRWKDQLRFTRDDGIMSMLGAVRILHRDTPEAQVLSIDADTATARIRMPGSADGELLSPGKQAELVSATCDGSVVAQLEGRRLTTDKLSFNAITGVLEAAATGENRATLTQPGSPTPVVARKLTWDTRKDQWRIVEPAPVVVPR